MMIQILHSGTPNLLLTSLVGWCVVVNLLAFAAFFLDHRRALTDQGAMPETPLLLLATMGGWLGAQLGQILFKGQSRERAFRIFLNISILPALALGAMMAAQDVDWNSLIAKIPAMLASQSTALADSTVEAPAAAKPVASKPDLKTAASKPVSVTDNPDLPKRIGPSSKKEAWHSR